MDVPISQSALLKSIGNTLAHFYSNIIFSTTELYELRPCQFDKAVAFLVEWFPDDIIMEVSSDLETEFEEFRYKFVEDMPMDSLAYQQLMEDFMYAVCSGSERPCED